MPVSECFSHGSSPELRPFLSHRSGSKWTNGPTQRARQSLETILNEQSWELNTVIPAFTLRFHPICPSAKTGQAWNSRHVFRPQIGCMRGIVGLECGLSTGCPLDFNRACSQNRRQGSQRPARLRLSSGTPPSMRRTFSSTQFHKDVSSPCWGLSGFKRSCDG
jgi:hypothetical protein